MKKNANILIVEDDSSSEIYYRMILEKNGYNVFSNTDDVLNIIEKNNINIVLLDLWLSPVNGFELAKQIKEKYPNVGIIAQTSHTLVKKEKNDNFDLLAYKPFSPKDILNSVEYIRFLLKIL